MYRYLTLGLLTTFLLFGATTPAPVAASGVTATAPVIVSTALPRILGIDLDDVVKVGGVVWVVSEYGEEINKFINTLLDNNDAKTDASTKVVVIISPRGRYIGAAQVAGPRAAVEKVRAVVQLEERFMAGIRVKAMVPIENEKATNLRRVQGVAVSAVIDVRI